MPCKGCQMRIEFVYILVDRVCFCGVAIEIEATPIPVGILVDDEAELVEEETGRLRPTCKTSPAELGAGSRLGKRMFPFASMAGLIMVCAVWTCRAVRQSAPSAALHARTLKSR